ncbi:MAG: tRNA dihydrouridine synthase DusB, partial [Methylococcaceae bacterium]|nr:tRNA dihydrouridine synthase DusB [Methylococcaceae bacterium]
VGEPDPVSVQIAGTIPATMAEAARFNVDHGAQLIDINMGCPAKKVCNVMAGSALLQDEALVGRILDAVVKAVPEVPVTLKIRTGWDREHRNALNILRIAENAGVQALAMHGRTRACGYSGDAEYDTIRAVKAAARIPVIANGDITSPEKAKFVLEYTGADAVMIGRAAQGRPWIFREIEHFLNTGVHLPQPEVTEIHAVLLEHIHDLYAFYGDVTGVRVARKHISWYTRGLIGSSAFRHSMNQLDSVAEQLAMVTDYFSQAARADCRLRYEASSDAPPEFRSASSHKNQTTQDLPPGSRLAA